MCSLRRGFFAGGVAGARPNRSGGNRAPLPPDPTHPRWAKAAFPEVTSPPRLVPLPRRGRRWLCLAAKPGRSPQPHASGAPSIQRVVPCPVPEAWPATARHGRGEGHGACRAEWALRGGWRRGLTMAQAVCSVGIRAPREGAPPGLGRRVGRLRERRVFDAGGWSSDACRRAPLPRTGARRSCRASSVACRS